MASHYLVIVLIACALYSVGGIEARRGPLPTLTSVTNGEGPEDFPSGPVDTGHIDPPANVNDAPPPGSNVLLESGPIPVHAVTRELEPPTGSDVLPVSGPIPVHGASEGPEPPPSSDVLPESGPIPVHAVTREPEPPTGSDALPESGPIPVHVVPEGPEPPPSNDVLP